MTTKYYDYEGVPIVIEQGKLLSLNEDGSFSEHGHQDLTKIKEDGYELPKEVFDKWVKDGSWEHKGSSSSRPPFKKPLKTTK